MLHGPFMAVLRDIVVTVGEEFLKPFATHCKNAFMANMSWLNIRLVIKLHRPVYRSIYWLKVYTKYVVASVAETRERLAITKYLMAPMKTRT